MFFHVKNWIRSITFKQKTMEEIAQSRILSRRELANLPITLGEEVKMIKGIMVRGS